MSNNDDYLEFEDYYIASAKFASISTAVDLGIFEHINLHTQSPEEISRSLKLDLHVLKALLKALQSLALLEEVQGKLMLTDKSKKFLLGVSRFYQGNEFLRKAHPDIHKRFKAGLEKGKASLEYSGQVITDMWQTGSIQKEAAKAFTHVMDSMMAYPANYHSKNSTISNLNSLIDVGGGSGAWAIELCNANPRIEVTVFDLPEVLEATKDIVKSHYSQNRITLVPGNFFDWIPKGEAYLLSNILHDWSEENCLLLLKKINESGVEDSFVYIHECLLDESEITPIFTSIFNLLMAVNHNSQQFTLTSLKSLMLKAGFNFLEITSQVGYYRLLKFQKEKTK